MADQVPLALIDGIFKVIPPGDRLEAPALKSDGGVTFPRTPVNANYPIAIDDYYLGVNTAAPRTLTLPTAVGVEGQEYVVKDETGSASTNNITVNTSLAQTIDGSASATIATDYEELAVISDGSNWAVLYPWSGRFLQSARSKVLVNTTYAGVAFATLLSVNMTCQAGSYLLIRAHAHVSMDAANRYGYFRLLLDGNPISAGGGFRDNNVPAVAVCLNGREQVLTTAVHTVALQWRVFNALWTVRCRPVLAPDAESASLVVEEVRR